MKHSSKVILIGYSGHAFVVCDIFSSKSVELLGYCEAIEKNRNPYNLNYLGKETEDFAVNKIKQNTYFVAIGNNKIRRKVTQQIFSATQINPFNAIDANASISSTTTLGNGIMVGNGAIINACCKIGNGVICNTQSVIEHECTISDYCHVAPGAVLCGNVKVGENTFIGAKSVVREGISIGKNVIIGAGTVVVKDIPEGVKVVGNPQKII